MIETSMNYPAPNPEDKTGKDCKYPWHSMEVDESFPVDKENSVRTLASQNSKDGKLFKVDMSTDGLRCWRLE